MGVALGSSARMWCLGGMLSTYRFKEFAMATRKGLILAAAICALAAFTCGWRAR